MQPYTHAHYHTHKLTGTERGCNCGKALPKQQSVHTEWQQLWYKGQLSGQAPAHMGEGNGQLVLKQQHSSEIR